MNFFNRKPLMKCPQCGFPVLSKHAFCPKCGQALTDEAKRQVEEQQETQRENWEKQFEVEKKKNQLDFDQKLDLQKSNEQQEFRKDEHQQAMADRDTQRSRDQQQFDFDLHRADKAADVDLALKERKFDFDLDQSKLDAAEQRSFKQDEHQQAMADRDTQRSRDQQQIDFDLEQKKQDADVERDVRRDEHLQAMADRDTDRGFRKDEHQQDMTDRDTQRNRDQQQLDFELKRAEKAADLDLSQQEKKFDFDLEQRKDEHQQAMSDRNVQRNRDQQQFDFELKRAEKAADIEAKQQEKKFDFDLEVQKQEKADEHVLRMEEHEIKMSTHEQDMADRESQRRMEELKMKGNIAMQNMQAMLDAKRAAQQDKFDAEERRLQTQKEMTAEQIMAAQIREMDAGAQAKFAESFSAGKDAAREREVAKEQAQIYEKMMGQMMDMAKTGMQTNADIANGRIAEERHRGDEYREEAHRVQERLDNTQEHSLKYTSQVTAAQPAPQTPPAESPIPLNTSWLREHGFEGSFNELAGNLHNLGADISQDYDNQGNPVIVVEGLSQAQVMDVLEKSGVKF
ncbi:MAG: hypothetical protein K5899_08530 [Bacteroidaceae bacterium]|nr:hypothetical protein [Bacteroidaceae bacterium]